jgi:hypothetical protein
VTPSEWIAALGEAAAKARAEAGHADVHVVIGGQPIRIRVAPANLRALLDPLAAADGSGEDGRTIELWDVGACGVSPPRLPPEARRAGPQGTIPWLTSETTAGAWQQRGPMLLAWSAELAIVSAWVGDSARLPAWERAAPLRVPLNWALRGTARTLAHAAAVGRRRGGPGLLIAGPSGSGKSTTALAWLLAGGDFAGDDYVLVDLDGAGAPAASPVYATAKVDPAAIELLPELGTAASLGDDELAGKSVLDVRDLRPSQPTGPIPIAAVVVPRVTHSTRPTLNPMTPPAALRAVAPSSVLQLPGETGGLRVLADLTRQLPCYEIELSKDQASNLDALDSILPA